MEKWADYLVTKVRFEQDRRHIRHVRVRQEGMHGLEPEREFTRAELVRSIDYGRTFVTAFLDAEKSTFQKGGQLRIVDVDGAKYVRVDENKVKKDDLGGIPEC